MAISRSSTDTETVDENLSGPGRKLRDARIARNLDLEEVASRLHLHVSIMRRIEEDDYENLPAPTFVRGYLRGYARMLDIAPEQIVGAYNSHEFDPPPLVRDISNTEEVRSTDISFRLATYLILTVVIVLVAIWWQNQEPGTPRTTSQDSELGSYDETLDVTEELAIDADVSVSPQIETVDNEQNLSDVGSDVTLGPAAADDELRDEVSTNDESLTTDALVLTTDEGELSLPVTDETVDAAADEMLTPQAEVVADASESVDTQTPQTAGQGPNLLRITLGSESWLEIYDQDNNKLFYDLAKAGRVVEFSEPGQMRVLLGNTSDVTVEVNSVKFDIGPHTDAGIARFHIPTEPNSSAADPAQTDTDQQ